eukprot:gene27383-36017_t
MVFARSIRDDPRKIKFNVKVRPYFKDIFTYLRKIFGLGFDIERELLEKVNSELDGLLLNRMHSETSSVLLLFSRITGPLNDRTPIAEKICQRQSRFGAAEKESSDDPQFIKEMVALHDKCIIFAMIEKLLSGNATLKDTFAELVNREVGKMETAELISSFCDRIIMKTLSAYLQKEVLPALISGDRYPDREPLLDEFLKRGSNFDLMYNWYRKFVVYLDRFHLKYHQLPPLEEEGLGHHNKEIVFDAVNVNLANAIIELIDREREGTFLTHIYTAYIANILYIPVTPSPVHSHHIGGIINRHLILSTVQIYERMGMGKLDVYRADLEQRLLEDTRLYYAGKANEWIAKDSTPDYLLRVEKALEEEKSRVSNYLNTESEARLLQVLDKELLEHKETELLEKEGSGLKVLLLNNMHSDISRMFRLFSRITGPPCGLTPIAEIYKHHIIDLGSEKISHAAGAADKESSDDPQFIK